MPNAVSCAYFALKNYKVAKEDENIFRGGIAGIQTIRTADAVTTAVSALPAARVMSIGGKTPKTPVPPGASFGSTLPPPCQKAGNALNKMAKFGRKLVYPLIVLSGVFNTVRSDDKVKTGASQATGIGLMYAAETIAERILIPLSQKIDTFAGNKSWIKGLWTVARGAIYVAASLGGYELGNRFTSSVVDKIRNNKAEKNKQKIETINNNPIASENNNVFSTMNLN